MRPKSLTPRELMNHVKNLQSEEIWNNYLRYLILNDKLQKRTITDAEKSEKEAIEKFLGVQTKGSISNYDYYYKIFGKVGIIKHPKSGHIYRFYSASKSFLTFFDGDGIEWTIDYGDIRMPKDVKIKSKQEIVKGKLGCDARRRLGGGGG